MMPCRPTGIQNNNVLVFPGPSLHILITICTFIFDDEEESQNSCCCCCCRRLYLSADDDARPPESCSMVIEKEKEQHSEANGADE